MSPACGRKLTLFVIVMLSWGQWDNAEDDEVVKAAYEKFEAKSTHLIKEKGLYHPWIYMNYANEKQDPYAGVGEVNRKKLKEIQKKYDPKGIFDKLQPGYFKI
jgi:hypothetical protein